MTIFDPLFNASFAVQLHVAGAFLAIVLLPLTLWRRRRDRLHRLAGYLWLSAMAAVALSSFFINGLAVVGPFGPIHLISVYVLWGLFAGLRAAVHGRIQVHQDHMRGLALGGLGVAGLLSFLPDRMMSRIAFGAHGAEGFWALALIAALLLAGRILRTKAANRRPV